MAKKNFKYLVPRRILLAFLIVVGIFSSYQFFIGNPFFDEVPPFWVYALFLLMAVVLFIHWLKTGRAADSEK